MVAENKQKAVELGPSEMREENIILKGALYPFNTYLLQELSGRQEWEWEEIL